MEADNEFYPRKTVPFISQDEFEKNVTQPVPENIHVISDGTAVDVPTQADEVSLVPVSYPRRIAHGFTELATASWHDLRDSRHRLRTAALGTLALATQVADRARLAVVFIPTMAVDIMKTSHSPAEAAIASGAAFAGWCAVVGSGLTLGLGEFPQGVKAMNENFPGVVNLFADSLVGLNTNNDSAHSKSAVRRVGGDVLLHTKRGLAAVGIGTTAYSAVATAQGRSKSDIHKLTTEVAIDGGIAAGVVVEGIGQTILRISSRDPTLALRITNDAGNIKLWYGVAGLLMGLNYLDSRSKRRKADKDGQLSDKQIMDIPAGIQERADS